MRDARQEVIDMWLIWLMIGAVIGVAVMCVVSAGRDDR